jgi:hypothetical protein
MCGEADFRLVIRRDGRWHQEHGRCCATDSQGKAEASRHQLEEIYQSRTTRWATGTSRNRSDGRGQAWVLRGMPGNASEVIASTEP